MAGKSRNSTKYWQIAVPKRLKPMAKALGKAEGRTHSQQVAWMIEREYKALQADQPQKGKP